jgi:hypothetical protein
MDDKRRCTATAKRSGERCRRAAIVGGTVCSFHGGKAPQVSRAAEVRAAKLAAHAEAERMVARAGVGADPVEHLVESLYRAAALVEVWGSMVAAIDQRAEEEAAEHGEIRGGLSYVEADSDSRDELAVRPRDRLLALNYRGEAAIHPYVREYQDALERQAKFAKLCIDAGVAERQVRLAENYAQLMADVFRRVYDDPELGLTDDQRDRARVVTARHLRVIEGGR